MGVGGVEMGLGLGGVEREARWGQGLGGSRGRYGAGLGVYWMMGWDGIG